MLKPLLVDKRYVFNQNHECWFKENENSPSVKVEKNVISVLIGDVYRTYHRHWLSLLAHYEVMLTLPELEKITFTECKSKVLKLRCQWLMEIRTPICYKDGYVLIPGFPGFIINRAGDVISLLKYKRMNRRRSSYGYTEVSIYDPDKNRWRGVCVHILLARAFLRNSDPANKFFVNHIDGNKQNDDLKNLEWVTSKENNTHAMVTGLKTDSVNVLVKDWETDSVSEHYSLKKAFKYLGMRSVKPIYRKHGNEIVANLFLNRFELMFTKDVGKRTWQYNQAVIQTARKHHKVLLEALELDSKKVVKAKSVKELSELTGVSQDRIESALRSVDVISHSGYLFRKVSKDKWPENFRETRFTPPKMVIVTNLTTGDVKVYKSKRSVTIDIGLDKRTLADRLKTGKSYDEFTFKEMSTDSPSC